MPDGQRVRERDRGVLRDLDDEKDEEAAESKATTVCKKQQSDNVTKFARDYKNFGQCVKTQKATS